MEENKVVEEAEETVEVNETDKEASTADQTESVDEAETVEEASEALETEVVEETDKAAEYLDRLQRLMAEFDNFRKRSEKEKRDSFDFAVSNTVVEILPVIDNFERALKVETEDKSFYTGVQMIYKQMLGVLEKWQVTPIEAEGQEFNPNLHNAIMHIDDEAYGENIVVEELQKGYQYKDKVIRHSLVKVAN